MASRFNGEVAPVAGWAKSTIPRGSPGADDSFMNRDADESKVDDQVLLPIPGEALLSNRADVVFVVGVLKRLLSLNS